MDVEGVISQYSSVVKNIGFRVRLGTPWSDILYIWFDRIIRFGIFSYSLDKDL